MVDAKDSGDLGQLKRKLENLQRSLESLIETTKSDLEIAKHLQKILIPQRLPNIAGIKSYAKYISAMDLSSESYDIIPTKSNKQVYFVASWTETFGLGSILLQTLVKIQSASAIETKPGISTEALFDDLCLSLSKSNKHGKFRLVVALLDLATLDFQVTSIGQMPFLFREKDRNQFKNWNFLCPESYQNSKQFDVTDSTHPQLSAHAQNVKTRLKPGIRLFYLSSSWRQGKSLEEFSQPLKLNLSESESDLVDDLNHLLIHAENYMNQSEKKYDLSGIALEIDSSKLHLA